MEQRWNYIDRGETEVLGEKPCLVATLSTTNPKLTDMAENPGLSGENSAINRLSCGTAFRGVSCLTRIAGSAILITRIFVYFTNPLMYVCLFNGPFRLFRLCSVYRVDDCE
jgi:hypothetical protein